MNIRIYGLSLMLAATTGMALAEETPQPASMTVAPVVVQQPTSSFVPVIEAKQPVQASVTAPVVQAAISQQAVLTAKDLLSVIQTPAVINNGALSGKYQAVRITLKNEKNYHIEVVHGEVMNAVDEAFAANEALQRRNNSRRAFGGLLRGASSLPFVGGLGGYASLGAYQAAAAAQTVANTAANVADATAQSGSANIEGRYVRTISSAVISPNDEYNFTVLLPKGQAPQLKVVFKTLETNQVFDIRQ